MMKLNKYVVLSLLIMVFSARVLAQDNPKNVLFIVVDDLNDWIGVLGGHPQARTPNIDKLAGQSVTFTKAYCAAPLCNPSRTAVLYGLKPSTTGVYENRHEASEFIDAEVPRLHLQFAEAGYDVIGAGKIFHNSSEQQEGWTIFYPGESGKGPEQNDPDVNSYPLKFGPVNAENEEMADMKMAIWVAEQLQKKRDRPLFLAVGFHKPHMPWYAPRKYFDMHPLNEVQTPLVNERDLDDVPPIGCLFASPGLGFTGPEEGDHAEIKRLNLYQRATQAYLATCSFADACVGKVLDALENSGQLEHTIIVLWGDHGWHLGEKKHWRKHTLWEESTRSPLLIRLPGMKTGIKCDKTVSLLDIYRHWLNSVDWRKIRGWRERAW